MVTSGALATEIIEMTGGENGAWVRVADLLARLGCTVDELTEAMTDLLAEDEGFRTTTEVHRHRLTDWEWNEAPLIGGERQHLFALFW
jgi:hypothetical protein